MTTDPLRRLAESVDGAKVVALPVNREAEADAGGGGAGLHGGGMPPDDIPPADDYDGPDDAGPRGPLGPVPEEDDAYTGLPVDCPVIALGKKGMVFYYLNPLHELVTLEAQKHSQTSIPALFSPNNEYLREKWPRKTAIKVKVGSEYKEEWVTTGWDVQACFNELMRACGKKGVWKSMERIRGAGGWKDDDGRLVFHCGEVLWFLDGKERPQVSKPGERGQYVYVGDAAILRPHDERQPGGERGPAYQFFAILKTWNYERPVLDPMFLLGQACCAFVAGALDWRPNVFITGDAAMGKSTLQHHLRRIHGMGGMIEAANATEAGIAAALGQSCLPVSIDELENDPDNRRNQDVIAFARLASSGDYRRRATQNIDTQATRALSCFTFSAIIPPQMNNADRRRIGMVRLLPFSPGAIPPNVSDKWLRDIGSKLKRRVADQWHRMPALLHEFAVMLTAAGHTSSTLKQYSTMMAMAWLVLHDHDVDENTMATYQKMFQADIFRETADTRNNALSCLDELVQAQPDVFKGGQKKSIAQIVREIVDFLNKHKDASLSAATGADHADLAALKNALAATALALVRARDGKIFLAVPNAHRLIAQIYQNSTWKAAAGTTGGWAEGLGRLAGARHDRPARVAGRTTKCCLVPLEHVLPRDDGDMDELAAAKQRAEDKRLKGF